MTKFPSGTVCTTPGINDLIQKHNINIHEYVRRHLSGDWGDCSVTDKKSNDAALENGDRLFSVYDLAPAADRIWIITEADRSATTVLLPEEY